MVLLSRGWLDVTGQGKGSVHRNSEGKSSGLLGERRGQNGGRIGEDGRGLRGCFAVVKDINVLERVRGTMTSHPGGRACAD
jgi:hypothetical protein